MPKNALSLRPTAAAALLSALFCVVELACARETQYFYNSVTGEVLYCALFDLQLLSSFFESNFFASLDPVSFCDRMIARRIFSLGVSLERGGGVTETYDDQTRHQNYDERGGFF